MTQESSQKLVKEALKLADEALEEAKLLFDAKKLRGSASRTYYAMFNAAKALLYSKGIEVKTHKGTITLLGNYFIKTKELDMWLSKSISEAFDLRQTSDYELEVQFGKEMVENNVKNAERFIKTAKKFLKQKEII